jgi:hypothetical protein
MKKPETNKNIKDDVEKTLKAFDGIKRARPKPFLYTRIQARLESKRQGIRKPEVLSPVFQRIAVSLVVIVVVFNIYTATRFFINSPSSQTISALEKTFEEEYYPSPPTLYTITQPVANP